MANEDSQVFLIGLGYFIWLYTDGIFILRLRVAITNLLADRNFTF